MALSFSLAWLDNAWSAACRRLPIPNRAEWCCKNLRIPASIGAVPGPVTLEGREYLRGIFAALDDPDLNGLVWVGCTQIGKTLFLMQTILSQGEIGRAPMLFAGPDQSYVRERRMMIYMMAEASLTLRRRIPPERLRNDRWIDLERCLIYLGWSGSTQTLSGRACKIVLCSEVDRWRSDPTLARERTKAFPTGGMVVFEGSPIAESPCLEPLYQSGDRRTLRCRCPHCGQFQELRFFPHRGGPFAGRGGVVGLKDAEGNYLRADEARAVAYYVCERSGCRIDQTEKTVFLRGALWAREGENVTPDGRITGQPVNPVRTASFRSMSLHSPTINFGDIAEFYLQHRDSSSGLERFFNDWLGMPFRPRGKTPKWKDLGERLAGSHPRGVVPRQAWFLTAGVDVQLRGVYWVLRAWGDKKTSWLIDWGYVAKPTTGADADGDPDAYAPEVLGGDLAQLDDVILRRRWDVDGQNPSGLSALACRVLAIDRGYRQTDSDFFVRQHPGDRVVSVYGDPKISPGILFRPHSIERDPRTGGVYEDTFLSWGIDTNAYKSEIADRWAADRTQPGVFWLPSNILETDGGEEYLRQITAEKFEYTTKRGRKHRGWTLIAHDLPNHLWDCEVYASCAADMVTGLNWDAASWLPAAGSGQKSGGGEGARGRGGDEAAAVREFPGEDFSAR